MLEGYRTIIAAGIALLSAIAAQAGFQFDVDGLNNAVITIAGLVGAIWFRWTATRDIRRGGSLRKD